ncbi:hypothetical protein HZC08_00815 [Candidatus Micrarchaeota archaeon]|nr:hypothetical protein [Candidatus Micrarchaeota archaeon]
MADNLYTMKITLKGEPRVLTIRLGEKGMDVILSDLKGKMIESFQQDGSKIMVTNSKNS